MGDSARRGWGDWRNWAGPLAAAACSLLAAPSADLWEALGSPDPWWRAGAAGAHLWRAAYAAGLPGIYILRFTLVFGLALLLWRPPAGGRGEGEGPEIPGTHPALRLVPVLALAALLPWGPGLLFYVLAAAALALAPGRLLLAFLLCIVWPSMDGLFPVGIPVVVLAAHPRPSKAWWLLAAPLLTPPGLLAVASGDFLAPFAAAWIRDPAFAASPPSSPVFWLVLLSGAPLLALAWEEGPALAAGALAVAGGIGCRPLAGLAPGLLVRRSAARRLSAASALLQIPFLIWFLASPKAGPPPRALDALRGLPRGGFTILTEPAWRGRVALEAGSGGLVPVQPGRAANEALAFRARYPEGLKPPFLGEPTPVADLLLLRPAYPKNPFPMALQPGWHLVDAGSDFALFARDTAALDPLIRERAIRAYDPYLPLPQEPEARHLALQEAGALAGRDPRFFEALRDAGRMETDFQMFDSALAHLEAALALHPEDPRIQNDLGVAFQGQGEAEKAREHYLKSIAMKPDELMPRMNLAGLDMSSGHGEEAEKILSEVVQAYPGFFPARRMLAQIFLSQERKAEAASVLAGIPPDSRSPDEKALIGEGGTVR
jgi:hypothetical protein